MPIAANDISSFDFLPEEASVSLTLIKRSTLSTKKNALVSIEDGELIVRIDADPYPLERILKEWDHVLMNSILFNDGAGMEIREYLGDEQSPSPPPFLG